MAAGPLPALAARLAAAPRLVASRREAHLPVAHHPVAPPPHVAPKPPPIMTRFVNGQKNAAHTPPASKAPAAKVTQGSSASTSPVTPAPIRSRKSVGMSSSRNSKTRSSPFSTRTPPKAARRATSISSSNAPAQDAIPGRRSAAPENANHPLALFPLSLWERAGWG